MINSNSILTLYIVCIFLFLTIIPLVFAETTLKLTKAEKHWLKKHSVIQFTGDPNWLPYEAFDEQGNYIGIIAEHLKLIEQSNGLVFKKDISKTWTESTNKAKQGVVDVLSETDDSDLKSHLDYSLVIKIFSAMLIILVLFIFWNRRLKYEVSQRKKIEEKLRLSSQKLIFHSENTPLAVIEWNTKFEVLDWNYAAEKIFGFSKEDVLGKHVTEHILPENLKAAVNQMLSDLIMNKGGARSTNENLTKDGKVIICDWYNTTILDVNDIVITVSSLVSDVTEQKKSLNALKESEERFHVMASVSPVAIFLSDAQGNNIYSNTRWTELTGLTEEESYGTGWTKAVHQDDFEPLQQEWQAAVVGHEPLKTGCRLIGQNGEILWVVVQSAELHSDDGEITGFVGAITDITEQKLAEIELCNHREHLEELVQNRTAEMKLARDESEKANTAKSEFLSCMSHELRTPLNAILGFAQILELDAEQFDEIQQLNIQEIINGGDHLLALINDVLDLAKIESGKFDISLTEIELDDVLHQSITLIKSLAAVDKLKIIDNATGSGYKIKADFIRYKQVLVNLLSNAAKYNSKNGCIVVNAEKLSNNQLRISITDNGAGLEKFEIERLFIPFERLNKVNNVDGAGIGLVITKELIELMGGSIGVECTPGEGCSFWVDIPLV